MRRLPSSRALPAGFVGGGIGTAAVVGIVGAGAAAAITVAVVASSNNDTTTTTLGPSSSIRRPRRPPLAREHDHHHYAPTAPTRPPFAVAHRQSRSARRARVRLTVTFDLVQEHRSRRGCAAASSSTFGDGGTASGLVPSSRTPTSRAFRRRRPTVRALDRSYAAEVCVVDPRRAERLPHAQRGSPPRLAADHQHGAFRPRRPAPSYDHPDHRRRSAPPARRPRPRTTNAAPAPRAEGEHRIRR